MATASFSRNVSHGFHSLVHRVAIVLFGFMNVFFMARMMTKTELGIWVLFVSVTAVLEMVRNGFIRNPFITHLVDAAEADKGKILTASVVIHVALSLCISVLLLGAAIPLATFWSAPGLEQLFFLYAVNNLIYLPYHHYEYLLQAHLRFKGILVSNMVRLGLLSVFIMLAFFLRWKISLIDIAVAQIIATLLGTVLIHQYSRNTIRFSKVIDKQLIYDLFHYGKYTLGTNISSMVVKNTDSWMIARMISAAGVALYNPAIRISNLVEVPTIAIAGVFFPQVTQQLKDNGAAGVRNIYTKSVSIILALTLPMVIPIFVFAELAIHIIFGPEYVESASLLRVTLFYTLIIPFNRQFGTVMDGIKKPKINFYLLVLVAVLNIVFNYFFLQSFGLIGSAYATLSSYIVVFILNQVILYRMFGINTFKVFREIIEWYKFGWNLFSKKFFEFFKRQYV